jgi:hypothetical protein
MYLGVVDAVGVPVKQAALVPVVPAAATEIELAAALADGTAITESTPAANADTVATAIRCLIVFIDIFFLSLVEFEYFPISARRSFDLLIPSPLAHTCNAK